MADARLRGQATVKAGRADAVAFLRTSIDDGLAWTQKQAVPRIVDGMMPYLVDDVMPRIIEGAMPEIRTRVLPVVIDDLSHDPRIRDLVQEQSRGMAGEAVQQMRTTTAAADDRVEAAFRRGRHGAAPAGGPAAESGDPPAAERPTPPPTDEATPPPDTG
jgi:hypothetical protein